jgi:hypothetical protein
VVIAGGPGAVAGFAMNGGLHQLVVAMDRLRKPIVAQCNGVFASFKQLIRKTDASILRGRLATTHSKSHEYRRGGWGWAKVDNHGLEVWTHPGAIDGHIITARTTPDGAPASGALIAALEQPGRVGRWFAHDDSGFRKADEI